MKLTQADLVELAELAIRAATEAGQMVAQSRPENVEHKADGTSLASSVVTEIDRRAEDMILDMLKPSLGRFELGLLSEEQEDDLSRLVADYFWCIDPIDGTLPFVEGKPGYAVSIGLVGRDGTPWIGVVYDPVEATLFHAIKGAGAFRDRQPWSVEPQPAGEELLVFVDRSFLTKDDHDAVVADLENIAQDLGLQGIRVQSTFGGVMNACGVISNAPGCYYKHPSSTSGGSLWDFAATACLIHEVGGIATDMSGDPFDLNRADSTAMNHRGILFASDDALAAKMRALRPSSS